MKLANASTWFLDGCFKMAPNNFQQVYFIKINEGEQNVWVVSALLQRKTQEAYHELFRVVVEKCEELFGFAPFPELCILDFEKGAHNALIEVLGPMLELKCCFFHLCQSTWRKILDLGNVWYCLCVKIALLCLPLYTGYL